MPEVEESAIFE